MTCCRLSSPISVRRFAEYPRDLCAQLLGVERLGDHLYGSRIADVLFDLTGRELAGDKQNRDVAQSGILLNRSAERKTVHPRHDDVRDEQVDVPAPNAGKRFRTIDRLEDHLVHPEYTPQTTPDVEPHIDVVIRHENRDGPRRCAVLVSRFMGTVCVHARRIGEVLRNAVTARSPKLALRSQCDFGDNLCDVWDRGN